MFLSDNQKSAVQALDWLLNDDNRRSGRSIAYAIALIRQALTHPRTKQIYVDHFPNQRNLDYIRTYIQDFIQGDPVLRILPWKFYQGSFSYSGSEVIPDWMPSEPEVPTTTSVWSRLKTQSSRVD